MSNGRIQDPGVWAGAAPAGGPYGAAENLGFWFTLDQAGWLTGFSQYSDGRSPNFVLFQLWTADDILIATTIRSAPETTRTPAGGGWRHSWLHPRCPLAAATPYLACMQTLEFWATFGALISAPITSGHITVLQSGSSPDIGNGVYAADTDAAGKWDLINPPHDPVSGHLYGLDLMIEFPL